jgi:hypothetical protein
MVGHIIGQCQKIISSVKKKFWLFQEIQINMHVETSLAWPRSDMTQIKVKNFTIQWSFFLPFLSLPSFLSSLSLSLSLPYLSLLPFSLSRVLLCSLGWPGTWDPPASTSQMLGFQAYTTMLGCWSSFWWLCCIKKEQEKPTNFKHPKHCLKIMRYLWL